MSSAVMPKSGRGSARSLMFRALAVLATAAVAITGLVITTAQPAAAVETIQFEAPNNNRVVLGDLASRSQRQPVTISGIGPYTVRGTDSATGDPYEFVTDWNYNASDIGWQRESDERNLNYEFWSSNTNAGFLDRSGVMQLSSNANCDYNNTFDGITTYCSTFGPDVYTEPFAATVGQAVSFDWAAQRDSDDYEIYAYLVRVDGTGYGSAADHTLIAYGRGGTQGWTTTSKEIPADGTYRFRFVNGSYDRTGGFALGSNMYIDSVVKLGSANPISFGNLSDRIIGDGSFDIDGVTAPGGTVKFSTSTPGTCSVSGNTVTLNSTGICTVLANQAGSGDYVPAETVARSFRILAAPTAPTNAGVPFIEGSVGEGNTITANEGTWTDGGSAITSTDFQWNSRVGGTATPISGEDTSSCYLVASPGSKLSVTVTKTNAIGSTSAQSLEIDGYTCGAPVAPTWNAGALGDIVVGTAVSQTFSASGITAPTYSLVAGAIPDGLSFNAASGRVSGTPTTAGEYSFTLRATNPTGTDDLVVSGKVNAAPGPITGAPSSFVVGEVSSGSVSATGTPAPGYSITAGALPAGVTLNPATGAFGGTPSSAGAYSFTVSASNGIGSDTTREFTGTVEQAPGWQTPTDFIPTVGVPLDVTFTAVGTPDPAYTIESGALPVGLTLYSETGQILGTPTTPGTYNFTIVATNSRGSVSLQLSGIVNEAPGAVTGGPGAWAVGESATGAVSATGTPAPIYRVVDGALPDGVSLNRTTGGFSGTPTTAGPYEFEVLAINGVGDETTQVFTGIVNEAPHWTDTTILTPIVGVEYTDEIAASGTPAPTYTVTNGALPAGLELDTDTGAITGTPTSAGPFEFTVTASNGVGDPAVQMFSGTVNEAPTWIDMTLATPRVGEPYSDIVEASGTPAAKYTVTDGQLPAGLTLDENTGEVSGTPTQAGAVDFTVTADNGVGTVTKRFEFTVVQSPVVSSTPKLPKLVVGTQVSVNLSAGLLATPAPTFKVTRGQLPDGMSLDEHTGMLTGTPTTAGSYFFVITIDNGTGELLTLEYSSTVESAPSDALSNTGAASGMQSMLVAGSLLMLGMGTLLLRARRRSRSARD